MDIESLILAASVRVSWGGLFCLAVSVAGCLLLITVIQSRRHASATDVKMCQGCSTPNPLHADYCRSCGRKL